MDEQIIAILTDLCAKWRETGYNMLGGDTTEKHGKGLAYIHCTEDLESIMAKVRA